LPTRKLREEIIPPIGKVSWIYTVVRHVNFSLLIDPLVVIAPPYLRGLNSIHVSQIGINPRLRPPQRPDEINKPLAKVQKGGRDNPLMYPKFTTKRKGPYA
jgi:hypothetical protein